MQINAFVPAEYVGLQGPVVNALGVPQTDIHGPPLEDVHAQQGFVPILLCVSAANGGDHDPQLYIKAHDQRGEVRGRLQQFWVWDDVSNSPMKWRVFALSMPFIVFGPGVYTFGVYAGADDGPDRALSSFALPVILDAPLPEPPTFRR